MDDEESLPRWAIGLGVAIALGMLVWVYDSGVKSAVDTRQEARISEFEASNKKQDDTLLDVAVTLSTINASQQRLHQDMIELRAEQKQQERDIAAALRAAGEKLPKGKD